MSTRKENESLHLRIVFHTAGVFAGLALSLTGCAKKREYKEVFKAEVQSKETAFDPQAVYIYVPSMLEAPMSSDSTRPGWQGTERLVKFRFTEKAMVAETVEADERFKDNPANAKPVLEIPVQHMDFRCADNGSGECSNREEVVDDREWSQKKYFRPELSSLRVQETNTLPIELDNLFKNCQSEIGSRVVSYRFERDALNVILEKTFKVSGECLDVRELDEVPDAATFNVRYHYSFARRDAVVSKDYAPVFYPQTDENLFGFFKTELHRLSSDNRDEEGSILPLMNRWNPARKSIPYLLSANFAKPEYARVLEATREAIGAVNTGLRQAGAAFQIDLQSPSDVSVGDIRNSMVLLVEDPQASGVIGYGPSVADPKTGEIISARVVMYLGTMKKFIRSTWDEFAAAEAAKLMAEKAAEKAKTEGVPESAPEGTPSAPVSFIASDEGEGASRASFLAPLQKSFAQHKAEFASENRSDAKPGKRSGGSLREVLGNQSFAEFKRKLYTQKDATLMEAKASRTFTDADETASRKSFLARRTELLSKYAYPADYLNAKGAIQVANLKELRDTPKVPWTELTDAQQKKVIDVVLPYVWVSTLIHELGHNMGLRHNFAGSEDQENFYTTEELKKLGHGDDADRPVIYSSVMDYSRSELNFLHVMGKYDVAALRFAYRREVLVKGDGTEQVAPVVGSIEQMNSRTKGTFSKSLKNFEFCTDENTGVNPGCRRFDEGTNLTEIAQSLQKSYADRYWRANFRNGRRSFSENDDPAYLSGIDDLLSDMRPFLETYDRIWKLFGGNPELDPEFNDPSAADFRKFYFDLKTAVGTVRDTYVKTVVTPGAGCLIQFIAGPNRGKLQSVSAKQLGGTFKSCFGPQITEILDANGAIAIAQYGKNFGNEKSRSSTNPWADQIDTRGVWGDKLLAIDYLVQRRLGVRTFDEYRGNFLDMTTFKTPKIDPATGKPVTNKDGKPVIVERTFDEKMVEILDGFLLNDVTLGKKGRVAEEGLPELELVLGDGSMTTLKNQEFNFFPNALHWIPLQRHAGIRKYFQLPKEDVSFAEAALTRVLSKIEDTNPSASATLMKDYYGLKTELTNSDDPKSMTTYDLGDLQVHAKRKNTFALNVIEKIGQVKTLSKVAEDRLAVVLAEAKRRETGAGLRPSDKKVTEKKSDMKPEEEAAALLPSAVIEAFMAGKFDPVDYYELVLRMVARANHRAEEARL